MTRRRLGPEMLQLDARAGGRERVGAGLGPLDEDDGAVEVRLEIAPLGGREAAEAVEVEVRHVHDPRVAMPDRERRARHARRHAERPRGTADERRLPDAELSGQEDDVAGNEPAARRAANSSVSSTEPLSISTVSIRVRTARAGRAGEIAARPALGRPDAADPRHGGRHGAIAPRSPGSRATSRSRPRASSACRAPRPGGTADRGSRCARRG